MKNEENNQEFTVYLKAWKDTSLNERRENVDMLRAQQEQLIIDITALAAQEGQDIIINPTPAPERAHIGLRCDPAFAEKIKILPLAGKVYPVTYASIDRPGFNIENLSRMLQENKPQEEQPENKDRDKASAPTKKFHPK